jgi:hypothetical protein
MTFHRGYRPRQKLILAKGWGVPPPKKHMALHTQFQRGLQHLWSRQHVAAASDSHSRWSRKPPAKTWSPPTSR